MTTRPPISVGEPEWDRGLWWMVLASGGLHVAAIGLLLLVPHTFLQHPTPVMSYTVDLVAPDKAGGTNMIRGGKGRVDAPPMVAAPAPRVEEPKPPLVKVEPKPPEPPKVEPPKPVPREVVKPVPPPEPPKVEEKPKEDEVALAEKARTIEPPPTPTLEPAAPTPQTTPVASPQPVATAAPPKPSAPPTIDAKAAKAAAEAKAAKAAAEAKAAKEAAEAKAAKAAADAKAAKDAAEAKARDTRIAAAVRRVEQQTGARGGGTGTKPGEQTGGAISVGSGEGAGGIVMGVEYLLYYNLLQTRIKQSWAWAGTNLALEAVVHFNISDSGEVMNVRITHSSGDGSFDASIERAVRSLNPLPPPPEKYRQQFSDVDVPFSAAQLQQ